MLPDLAQDLASFLLVRGPYAWLGHGWVGCDREYHFPPEFTVRAPGGRGAVDFLEWKHP